MQFRLLASLDDGISLYITKYRCRAPLPLCLKIASTSYSSSPSTTIGEGNLFSLSNSLDQWNLFRFEIWKIGWIHQAGEDPIRTPLEKSPWQLSKVQFSASVIWKVGAS